MHVNDFEPKKFQILASQHLGLHYILVSQTAQTDI